MPGDPVSRLRATVGDAVAALAPGTTTEPAVERPPKPELGDYSTNAAMLLAPVLKSPPREVAAKLKDELEGRLGTTAERLEIAGPGFVNVFYGDRWHRDAVADILAAERFGAGPPTSERVLIEFVSANPTGPLTAAGGRHAAYGDALARVIELAGSEVGREYYSNDAGGQISRFAASIAARMRSEEPPPDGYAGEYVGELAELCAAQGADPGDLDQLGRIGVAAMTERIRATLERYGVEFDHWASERSLYESGAVDAAIADLRERGHVFDKDGAVWLRTTEFGDDKDRVLYRSDGEPTYMTGDVAYHRDKLARGWTRLLDVWGADHHGYVARMRAALEALGGDPAAFEVQVMQLVHVVDAGQRAQMSKRKGEFVTLDELLDDIGADATRFFLLQRSHDTTVDLDLDLARSQSQENPVYYVQYAHARICGILAKAAAEGSPGAADPGAPASEAILAMACEPAERVLIRRLLELPGEVELAAAKRAPHRLCAYAMAVAADFHAFYRDCRVVGVDMEFGVEGLEQARIGLCAATARVISGSLALLGISAPERM